MKTFHVIENIVTDKFPLPTIEDGKEAMRIAISIRQNTVPVVARDYRYVVCMGKDHCFICNLNKLQ